MGRPTVCLDDLIADIFIPVRDDFLDQRHAEYWLSGGRGSTKSSFVSLMIVVGILTDKEANAIIYRKVANTLRKSVFEQIIWAIDTLGVSQYFRRMVSPMEIIHINTGQRILFYGADDPNKSKSIKLSRGYFKYLWFEEVTEFRGMDEIRTIQASVIRGGGWAATLYSYNPPMSALNWANDEALNPRKDRLVHHSNYTQVPPEWVGTSFIAAAEALRESNDRAYRHVYLGEVTGTGGRVFENLSLRRIAPDERSVLDTHFNGLDFGFAVDPDALVRMHHCKRTNSLYLLDELYSPKMSVLTLAEKAKALCGREWIVADAADPRMINELSGQGVRIIGARKGPGSVEHGIRWLQDLNSIVIDQERCPNAAREFYGYEYAQDRYGNFIASLPDKNNHTIDAVRYGMESTISQRRAVAVK